MAYGLGLGLPFGTKIGPSPVFVSATIANVTPTVVMIVMDIAMDETYTATDEITLAGKTVSSVTVSGTDITVTVSVAFAYGDTPTVVYTKGTLTGATGGSVESFSETVTNNITHPLIINDGNTVGWFAYLENITKDGSDRVSAWGDKSGLAHHLLQAGADAIKPTITANGVLFDGTDDFMKGTFTYNQPEMIYVVVKQVTWTFNDEFFDGATDNTGLFGQIATTPGIKVYAGSFSGENNNLAVNTFGIVRILFNGATSKLQVNNTSATTGDFGTNNMGGITLATRGSQINLYGNVEYKEIILRKVADTAPNEAAIYAYLAAKYSI